MPRKPVIELPPIDLGEETIGQRISRLRKEKGLTQKQLANIIGTTQGIISDYEIGRIRLYDEMVARFSLALEISADNLLGLKNSSETNENVSLRYTKRIKEIDKMPEHQKRVILKIIDDSIKANS